MTNENRNRSLTGKQKFPKAKLGTSNWNKFSITDPFFNINLEERSFYYASEKIVHCLGKEIFWQLFPVAGQKIKIKWTDIRQTNFVFINSKFLISSHESNWSFDEDLAINSSPFWVQHSNQKKKSPSLTGNPNNHIFSSVFPLAKYPQDRCEKLSVLFFNYHWFNLPTMV